MTASPLVGCVVWSPKVGSVVGYGWEKTNIDSRKQEICYNVRFRYDTQGEESFSGFKMGIFS